MRYDNIVIGGGLSGLVSAIESARSGRRTAIVTTGQSALHFWSGSFEFLCRRDGREIIDSPLDEARHLTPRHPYRLIGIDRTARLLSRVESIFADAGIKVNGSLERNHYRLTPLGIVKPAWLTLDEYFSFSRPEELAGKKMAIVNIYSYLDFYPRFIARGLNSLGVETSEHDVNIPQLDVLRKSTTEMRATNMSRFLRDDAVDALADQVEKVSAGADMVVMPAILGIFTDEPVKRLRRGLSKPVCFLPTTPASVPGVRCQLSLRSRFISLGGDFMPGDTVVRGVVENHRLRAVYTSNFGDMPLEADNFVFATGSFFGHGLVATMDHVYEPVLGLDTNAPACRRDWYRKDVYDSQPYMGFGVLTDDSLRPGLHGETLDNVYATGALLPGFNALHEGSGAGVTLASALHAADMITR